MKKKFSKILGVGLTLALLTSLLLTAAPVAALTQPSVALDNDDIGATGVEYAIMFNLGEDLPDAGTSPYGKIIIEFPTGTDLTAVAAGDISIAATSGIGSGSFSGVSPTTIVKSPSATTGPTVTITVPDIVIETKIGVGAMVQVLVDDVKNPGTPGDDYTLDVSTVDGADAEIEAVVTSAPYELEAPTIGALPGIVGVYNDTGILMTQYTGDYAIRNAIGAAGEDYVIKIGPGTYDEAGTTYVDDFDTTYLEAVTGDHDGITFEASGAVENVILEGSWNIDNNEITLDGLTIKGAMTIVGGDDLLITECVFEKLSKTSDEMLITWNAAGGLDEGEIVDSIIDTTYGTADDDIGIVALQDGLTISGSSFMVNYDDIAVGTDAKTTVEDSEFTGSSGVGVGVGGGTVTIDGNTFDGLDSAVNIDGGTVTIKNNTITNSTGDAYAGKYYTLPSGLGGAIHVENATQVLIVNNTISDTDDAEYALDVEDDADKVYMVFNNITGNEKNVDDNDGITTKVNATHNWWGDADDPASDSIAGDVDTSSYLGASVTGAAAVVGATSLDAETAAGVKVSGATGASIIGVASYSGNPQEAIDDALAFFDVYVCDATVDPTLKFYAGDADTVINAWSVDTEIWVEQDCSFSAFGGYVYATVDRDLLEGTPIALIYAPVADTLDAPDITAPASGAEDVLLKPTLAWGTVDDAIGYDFELADNPLFVIPLASLTGDLGRLTVTFYQQVAELDYSTYYYWRVKAVSADAESAWSAAVFMTMAEVIPEPEVPPVWTCPVCGLDFDTRAALEAHAKTAHPPVEPADIIVEVEPPDIIVPLPAETPITPAWIYAIIGVGAVLVIAVIVLIVRTRRVA